MIHCFSSSSFSLILKRFGSCCSILIISKLRQHQISSLKSFNLNNTSNAAMCFKNYSMVSKQNFELEVTHSSAAVKTEESRPVLTFLQSLSCLETVCLFSNHSIFHHIFNANYFKLSKRCWATAVKQARSRKHFIHQAS